MRGAEEDGEVGRAWVEVATKVSKRYGNNNNNFCNSADAQNGGEAPPSLSLSLSRVAIAAANEQVRARGAAELTDA